MNRNWKKGSIFRPLKAIRFLFRKPKTLRYPFELKEPALRYRGFHLNDWDKCTGCGNCADICPNEAITMVEIPDLEARPEEGRKNERPRVDYGRCCFCGLCVDICPPGSLRLSRDYIHIHYDPGTFVLTPGDEKTDPESFRREEDYSVLQAGLAHRRRDYQGFAPDLAYALFEPERVPMDQVPPDERKLSFIEQVAGYSREEAVREASRCLECKLCEEACPAHLKISDYIRAISEDNPEESLKTIYRDNPLPSICGRICMRPCETACSLSFRGEALSIRWLKRYASDTVLDYEKTLQLHPGPATGKRIAVVGAGPSGLSAAYFLTLQGHQCVIYDELPGGGGMMRVGPPPYRLPLESIDRDVDYIRSLGVEFRFSTRVGRELELERLREEYDAVYLATGNMSGRSSGVKNGERCVPALDFLRRNKIGNPYQVSRKVIVIGGGNVAMDVAREALRLQQIQYPGEETVTETVSLEDWDALPASEDEVEEAREEGIQFNPGWGPKEVVLDGQGNIQGLLCRKVASVLDAQGRFSPTFREGEEMLLEGDMVIEAIGQGPDFSYIPGGLFANLEFTARKKVKVDEDGMTSLAGVFAGGDIVNTCLDAVHAIADAKIAAGGIDKYLQGETT